MTIVRVMSPSGFYDRLRKLRTVGRVSGRKLARLVGWNETSLAAAEAGGGSMSAERVLALAKVLGTTVEWLVSGEGSAPTEAAVLAAVARAESLRQPKPRRRAA